MTLPMKSRRKDVRGHLIRKHFSLPVESKVKTPHLRLKIEQNTNKYVRSPLPTPRNFAVIHSVEVSSQPSHHVFACGIQFRWDHIDCYRLNLAAKWKWELNNER